MRSLETTHDSNAGTITSCKNAPTLLEEKVSELIQVIQFTDVDSKKSRLYQQQIAEAFKKSGNSSRQFAPFEALPADNSLSREELLDELEKMLLENEINSKQSRTFLKKNAVHRAVLFVLSTLLIITGFAMIIMPAPPSFELFTVFYFNANDGVTIMDLVSLLIIFGGVFLFVLNLGKK
jgi:hypothetical protein